MPRMMRDIVAAIIVAQPDMTIVGESGEGGDAESIAGAVAAARPDVLIVGMERAEGGEPPVLCAELLSRFPQVKVIAVEDHGRSSALWELRPHRALLGEVSPQGLVDSIRAATGPEAFVVRGAAAAPRSA